MDEIAIMKRVLHIVGKMDRAGAETMIMNLYRNIDREKIQFDFITFTKDQGDYDDEIIQLGGRIIPIIASNPIQRMIKLSSYLKSHPKYEIVHAHMLLSNAFHLLAAKQAGVKHRISHSHNTSNGNSTRLKKIYEHWALFTNRKIATYKMACGVEAAKYLFGSSENVTILPNAIDIDKALNNIINSENYIASNIDKSINKNTLKIIQVGRLNPVKNHIFSLKIAKELKQRDIDFKLYIVGQGPLQSEIHKTISEYNLDKYVILLGVRDDIMKLMASSDFLIMPSFHEGFPVVLVESQAGGLRAVVSNRVSPEVDLNLGLVDFLPINDVNAWVNILKNRNIEYPTKQEIEIKLKKLGFDIKQNAENLTNVYLNL